MRFGRMIWLAAACAASTPLADAAPADDALAADTAFAARAGEIGYHDAFVEYLAPDAVLFRPEAVRGQDWLAANEPAAGQLEWTPSAAAASCNGRLAVTSGPWRYSNDAGGEPVAGHYLSVWRLMDDGRWLAVLDHGIDHAGAVQPGDLLATTFVRFWPHDAGTGCGKQRRDAAPEIADQELNERIGRVGLPAALRRVAADGALAYRDDLPPVVLAPAGLPGDGRFAARSEAQTLGIIADPGGDLAVTHGVLRSADGSSRALYVRVWQRDRKRWQVAVDLQTPLPLPTAPATASSASSAALAQGTDLVLGQPG